MSGKRKREPEDQGKNKAARTETESFFSRVVGVLSHLNPFSGKAIAQPQDIKPDMQLDDPLYQAFYGNPNALDMDIINDYIKRKAFDDFKNLNLNHPLFLTLIRHGAFNIANKLVDQDILPNHQNASQTQLRELLIEIALSGATDVLYALYQHGITFTFNDSTLLHEVVKQRSHVKAIEVDSLIRLIIRCGVNVDAKDKSGATALHYVTDVADAQTLLDCKATINVADNEEMTPLFRAVQRQDAKTVDLMLGNNANAMHLVMAKQRNIMNFAKQNSRHTDFSRNLKQKVQFNPQWHSKMENDFFDLFTACLQRAKELNRKLIILLGEAHNEYRGYQAEKAALKAAGRIPEISHLFLELAQNDIPDRQSPFACEYLPMNYAIRHTQFKIIGADIHRKKNILPDASPLGLGVRDIGIRDVITKTNEHGIAIIGANHLYGLVEGGGSSLNRDAFFIIPVNLSSFLSELSQETESIRDMYKLDEKKVIAVTEAGWDDKAARKVVLRYNKVDFRN